MDSAVERGESRSSWNGGDGRGWLVAEMDAEDGRVVPPRPNIRVPRRIRTVHFHLFSKSSAADARSRGTVGDDRSWNCGATCLLVSHTH